MPGTHFINATTLQVKHFVVVELADCGSMGAFDVIGNNLKLRFGVNARFRRQQQGFAQLPCVGELGGFGHHYSAIKNRVGVIIDNAFVNLMTGTVRFGKGDRAMGITNLIARNHCQSIQYRVRLFTDLINL